MIGVVLSVLYACLSHKLHIELKNGDTGIEQKILDCIKKFTTNILLSRSLLLSGDCDLLALPCPSIALGVLSSAWKALNVAFPSVTLNIFQSLNGHGVESPLHNV